MVKNNFIFLLFLCISHQFYAQKIEVEFPVGILNNEEFDLVYTIYAAEVSNARISEVDGIELKNNSQPSTRKSAEYSNVNGIVKQVATTRLTFRCSPKVSKGVVEIPTLYCTADNVQISSKKHTIRVLDDSSLKNRKDYILLLVPNTDSPFEGESFSIDYVYLFSQSPYRVSFDEFPEIPGWRTSISAQKTGSRQRFVYNGKLYTSQLVSKTNVVSDSAGVFKIPAVELQVVNGRERTKIYSDPISITVLKKPSPIPKNYLGIFSELELKHTLPDSETNSDQAVELELTFYGKGDFNNLQIPDLKDLSRFYEVYEPGVKTQTHDLNFGSEGEVNLNYTLVPKQNGQIMTSPVYFSFLNREKQAFDTLLLDSFMVYVNKAQTAIIEDFENSESETIQRIPASRLKAVSEPIFSSYDFLGAVGGMLGMGCIILGGIKFSEKRKQQKNIPNEIIGLELFNSEMNSIQHSKTTNFSGDILDSFEDYLIYKFKMKKADFNKNDILEVCDSSTASKIINSLRDLEVQTFASSEFKPGAQNKDKTLKQIRELAKEIDDL